MKIKVSGKNIVLHDSMTFENFEAFSSHIGKMVKELSTDKLEKVLKPIYNEYYKTKQSSHKTLQSKEANAQARTAKSKTK